MKVCSKCKLEKELNEFTFSKKSKDGLHSWCKQCKRESLKKYRESNREEIRRKEREYRNVNKDHINSRRKQWSHSNIEKERDRKRKDYHIHKEIRVKKHKQWLTNNKDKTLERQREYYKEHPELFSNIRQRRRSRKKNVINNFTWEEWETCLEYFDYKCAYCGKRKKLEQDHFIPLANGGNYTSDNIIPAFKSCNSSKCDNDFFEWYQNKPYYDEKRKNKILNYLSSVSKQQLALF